MAKDKIYSSILDSFLDLENREPDWKDLGLKDAVNSGEEVLDRTHDHVDDLLDALTGSASKKASNPLAARMAEKEASAPRVGGNRTAGNVHTAAGEEDSALLDEVTMSFDTAAKEGKIEKKHRSDAEVLRWVKNMLNAGVPPSKVAAKLNKLAELELYNKTMAEDYLNRNSGVLGLAYLEPNTYMEGQNPQYNNNYTNGNEHTANQNTGSDGCLRQAKAWKAAGITPRAKSVKQIAACKGCSHFKNKTCTLYGLPVVANEKELSGVVNKLTAGVPAQSKKAALVQIANRTDHQVKNTVIHREAAEGTVDAQAKRASSRAALPAEKQFIDGALIQKLHVAGNDLKKIAKAAAQKFGTIETSRAIREFVASLKRTDEGNIVLAKADADFLKTIGIRNASIVGAEKCLSCATHIAHKEHKQASKSDLLTRVDEHKFQERTLDQVRASQTPRKVVKFDGETVGKLHTAGHSLEKIYQVGTSKVGSAQARKAVKDFVGGLKNSNTKVALTQIDCTFLKNKLGSQNAIVGQEKCASCTFRQGMHCGFTGGTLLSFPGMDKQASNIKVATTAPKDGYAMLNEYDLMGAAPQADIDISAPERAEIEIGDTMTSGDIG